MTTETPVPNRPNCSFAAAIVAAVLLSSPTAGADGTPSAEELSAAVSDRTYQGSMLKPTSSFSEYYHSDGTISGDGYAGTWRVDDGAMCFTYGENPERCFDIELQGPSMVMFKEGKVAGNGVLLEGNPHDF